MDNLKYYNDSLAYDFNMFMPRETAQKVESDNIIKLPKVQEKQRVRRKVANKTVSVSMVAVMFSVFVVMALCGNIFLRLKINEVNSQIHSVKSELNLLDSERTSLEVDFERRISYSNIEVEATEMGMQKKDKAQVKYIRVNETDTAVTSKGELLLAE